MPNQPTSEFTPIQEPPKPKQATRMGAKPEPTNFDDKLTDRLFRINAERLMNMRRNLTLDQVRQYVSANGINTEDDAVFDHLLTADVPELKKK